MKSLLFLVLLPLALLSSGPTTSAAPLGKPILYVTQTPMPDESLDLGHIITGTKLSVASTMQSPLADPAHVARGGALWIRYADGTKVNLTSAAGLGGPVDGAGNATGFQGASSIAVQHPSMHWNGTKAIFSMVVGAPTSAADTTQFHWQLYEITNFAQGQTPVISYVAGQPASYNNYQACYDTQDRIIFVSDAPFGMQAHLYPQLDQYMSLPCNTGLYRLDRTKNNELKHIIHAPSGCFSPFIDSFGRVMFVQWDHLARDPFATYDRAPSAANGETWTQTFNGNGTYDSEAANATFTKGTDANYPTYNFHPEPRNFDKSAANSIIINGVPISGMSFNQFFPWECREDGSAHEVDTHVGRHEFGGTIPVKNTINGDANLVQKNFTVPVSTNFLHLIESPVTGGTFYAVGPPEYGTHMAAPIIRYNSGPGVNPDTMQITYLTQTTIPPNPALGQSPLASPVDLYRNPLPLSDGSLLAVHAAVTQYDSNSGTATSPKSRYAFRLRTLVTSGNILVPDPVAANAPTSPQNVSLTYYVNGTLLTYSGAPLWELDPVEVIARPNKPNQLTSPIASVEQTVFDEEKVHAPTFQNDLRTRGLALIANRDSTHRDAADKQQPYNLKVSWSAHQTVGAAGKIYDIGWVQLYQADAIRAYTHDGANPNAVPAAGRRCMPVPMHDSLSEMPTTPNAPPGAVKIADDGSWAAIVPAGRAMTWHMLDGSGTVSYVKERYEVTFAPGEIRTCAVCHGVNTADQAGNLGAPVTKPQALRPILQYWRANHPPGALQHAAPTASAVKNAGTATLSVTRTGGSTGPVSVNFSTADGSAIAGTDYTATNGTLNWADGDTAPKTITIPLLNNPTIGAAKSLTVTLTSPQYGDLGATTVNTLTLTETPFNAWRYTNFGANANTPGTGLPTDDPDQDGQDNQSEFIAGTVPTNPQSVFTCTATKQGGQVVVQFTAQAGIAYTVQYKAAITDPTWLKLSDVAAPATTQLITVPDPGAGTGQRYYRVVTPQAP